MAEAVIDGFEAIDVAHEDHRREVFGERRSQREGRGGVKAAAVEQSRQLIGVR